MSALNVSSPKDNGRLIPSILNLREAQEGFENFRGPKASVLGSMLLQVYSIENLSFELKTSILGLFEGINAPPGVFHHECFMYIWVCSSMYR